VEQNLLYYRIVNVRLTNQMAIEYDESLRRRLISISLIFFAVLALFQGYIDSLPFLPENWHVPVIFVSIVLLMEMMSEVSTDVDRNNREIDEVLSDTHEMGRVIQNSEFTEVEVYRNYDRHFKDVAKEIGETKNSISLTHVQTDPPDSFGSNAVDEYYSRTEQWIENHPDGKVRRIITISNESLYEWARYLLDLTEEYEKFRVRVCTWESEFPMINMALLDDETAYFALTFGHAQDTRCLRINDSEVVEVYERYFNYMWQESDELDEAIEKWEAHG